MKLNSRLLISELCAAGAVALCSAILIVGCATGERTGKFWNKGDVASSDAYVANELAKDQSFATSKTPGAATNGKVATVSGTQDAGRVSVPDFPDQPPPPLTPPAAVTMPTSPRADASRAAAAGSAQAAAAVAGGAQIAGNVAPGSIVAPYVQKRSPSGTLDNNLHDSEILKPKQVFAKQLDPFAATDAEPFLASPNAANRSLAPAPRVANPAPAMASASPPAAVIHSTPASANPFAEGDSALPLVVAKKANAPQAMTQPVSAPPAVAPSLSSTVAVPAASGAIAVSNADAFDPSAPPPVPNSATSAAVSGAAEPLPTTSQSAHESAAIAAPTRRHGGIRLGDENLDDDQQTPSHAEAKPVVEPASTQVTAETHPPAATSPYEADRPSTSSCVAPPPAPVRHPASATLPAAPSPTQDSWESTKVSKPAAPKSEPIAPIPAPARVSARQFAPMELVPQQHAPVMPDAMVATPTRPSAAPSVDAPIKAAAEDVGTATSRQAQMASAHAYVERPKSSAVSGPMICDSVSVHRKYTGGDSAPVADAPPTHHDAASQKPKEMVHAPSSAKAASHAPKRVPAPIEGKTTSCWDDPFASSTTTQRVSTADFSVPAPGPFEAEGAHSIGHKTSGGEQLASTGSAHASAHARSRAWIALGAVGCLAAASVVWLRRRHHSPAQLG
ncbi:MAG TPA: hypothetical protein VFG04_24545 [Planctomycetaceae bacterium]|jgi:hypothetical protein|nr:hypothetical protein [Planctomycetaceae bacterium]